MSKDKKALKSKTTEGVNSQEAKAQRQTAEKKKTNKTWEAFGRSKGCFIINDPKFLL